ncbi:hypothetical protein HYC85_014535 [Camellia sinensis]|uniref:Uncharacterized protein n=1 Tax=Camellia sinensis TaxID=4442 RepID=A0A7J7H9V9_CAMSI|nr:hypothetical protein HYC85_014535 [Camellia sinensis]
MKSLMEFVSCCGSAPSRPDPLRAEETQFLVLPSSRKRPARGRYQNRKRGSSGTSADWRPSLGALSEDNVVPESERERWRSMNAGSERMLKRKASSSSSASTAAGVSVRNYSSDNSGYHALAPNPEALSAQRRHASMGSEFGDYLANRDIHEGRFESRGLSAQRRHAPMELRIRRLFCQS